MATSTPQTKNKKNKRNYYRVLFVQPDAPMEIVQTSYRTIMQKLKAHPDLGGDTWNAAVINEAYEVLADPERRARYDSILFAEKDMETLTIQSQAQRYKDIQDAAAYEQFSRTWHEFRPRTA